MNMEQVVFLVIEIGVCIIGIGIGIYSYFRERYIWNCGLCRETGTRWVYMYHEGRSVNYESFYPDETWAEVHRFKWYIPGE